MTTRKEPIMNFIVEHVLYAFLCGLFLIALVKVASWVVTRDRPD
jgi:hypothetical protein